MIVRSQATAVLNNYLRCVILSKNVRLYPITPIATYSSCIIKNKNNETDNLNYNNKFSTSKNSTIDDKLLRLNMSCYNHHIVVNAASYTTKSYKSKNRKTSNQSEYDSDDDDEDEWQLEKSSDFKDVIARVSSLRVDSIIKAGTNLSKSKIEEAFYGGKIYVNGTKLKKKSLEVNLEDEVDVVIGTTEDGSDLVARVVLLKIGNVTSKITVLLRKYPKLEVAQKSWSS